MAFTHKIENTAGRIGIWEFDETVEELLNQIVLSKKELSEFNKITAEKRKKEFLAVRILLQKLLGEKTNIHYSPSGKPLLKKDKLAISISHSQQLAVVFISKKNIGIDVENTKRNIEKVANRFLSDSEKTHIKKFQNQNEINVVYWSAKEAIFKCTPFQNIDFSQQITIQPFELNKEGSFSGLLKINGNCIYYQLNYFFFKNNVIVSCVESKN